MPLSAPSSVWPVEPSQARAHHPGPPAPARTATPPPGIAFCPPRVGAVGGAQASVLTPRGQEAPGPAPPLLLGPQRMVLPRRLPSCTRGAEAQAPGKETPAVQTSGGLFSPDQLLRGLLQKSQSSSCSRPAPSPSLSRLCGLRGRPPGSPKLQGGPGRKRSQTWDPSVTVQEASCCAGRLLPGKACARPCFRGTLP